MRRRLAALYLDISEAAFIREVASGRLPPPVAIDGRHRWMKSGIDAALGKYEGQGEERDLEEWRRRLPLYADSSMS